MFDALSESVNPYAGTGLPDCAADEMAMIDAAQAAAEIAIADAALDRRVVVDVPPVPRPVAGTPVYSSIVGPVGRHYAAAVELPEGGKVRLGKFRLEALAWQACAEFIRTTRARRAGAALALAR